MNIIIELQQIESQRLYIPDEMIVQWKRGPQSDESQKYRFKQGETAITMNDKFERVSKFREKNKQWEAKMCEF